MKNHLKILRWILISGLLMTMLACNIPFIQISFGSTESPTVQPVATEAPTDTLEGQPTNSPMAEMPPTQSNLGNYDTQVIHFTYDLTLFTGIDSQTIQAVQPDPNSMPFDVAPLHTELTFQGYLLQGTSLPPQLKIYPAAEFGVMEDFVNQDINDLKQLIANQSGDPGKALPFVPPQNAGQIFHSNYKLLQFQNGHGIRYLSQYAQALYPINNYNVFYTFQGITEDGKTYVSLVLPVNNPVLPNDGNNPPGGDWTAFNNNFASYLNGIVTQLNSSADASFTPNLELLDAMVQSITLK
jgi:hypothetical protein